MRSSRFLLALAAVAVGGVSYATYTTFQEGPPEPTEQHELITQGVGEWTGTITMHDPNMPEPMKAPCTELVHAVGGLWTTTKFTMDFMGMPFEGAATLGYDTYENKYVGTWIDSMTPTLTVMEGEWDDAKNAIVMQYESRDMTGAMKQMRSETVHDENSYTCKFYDVTDGETLQMEIDMKRKAKGAIDAGAKR